MAKKKIAIGADHGGFARKQQILPLLARMGYKVLDVGCYTEDSCDYPDLAVKVGQAVARGKADKGILVCGTGIGVAIAANKIRGVRAAVVWNPKVAALASEHNNANVLCISGRFQTADLSKKIVKAWLSTPFAGGRHERRVNKIKALERK